MNFEIKRKQKFYYFELIQPLIKNEIEKTNFNALKMLKAYLVLKKNVKSILN